MTEITTKYNLDFGDTFQKLESLAETVGTVDEVMRKKRGNPVYEEYARSATKFNQTLGQQIQIVRQIEATNAGFRNELKRLDAEYKNLQKQQREFIAAGRYQELQAKLKATKERIHEIKIALGEAGNEMEKLPQKGNLLSNTFGKLKGIFAAVFAIDLIKDAGQAVLETTAKYEKYNAILATTLGSTDAGALAFEMLQQFAAKTNFSLDELTDSYIKLANRGLRPSQEELMKVADVANATGKPFGDLVEAINDINNTERWNEIGIKASTAGNKVTLTFKGVTQTVDRTEAGVLSAITAFGKMDGVMGMTAKISNTLDGQLSNLKDNFDQLKATVGNDSSGAFRSLIGLGNDLIQTLLDIWKGTEPVRDGLGKVAGIVMQVGDSVGTLIKSLFEYDDKTKASQIITDAITVSFKIAATTLLLIVGNVGLAIDSFNVLVNTGKKVANFFGAEFKLNPKANVDTLVSNYKNAGKAIDDLWKDTEKKREQTSKATNQKIVTDTKKNNPAGQSPEDKAKAQKAMEDERKALLKASEEYLKEYQKLEAEYGKARLESLRKDSEEYIQAKAQADKDLIKTERDKLEALLQLAASNKTQVINGERVIVPNRSVKLTPEMERMYSYMSLEVERKASEEITKLREEKRLQMLSLERRFDELEIEEAKRKWDELIKKEKDGSAEQLRLRELKQKDLTRLGLQQALTANDGQEQVAMSILDRQFKPTNMREVDFEKYKQEKILEITIEYAEKRLAFLEAIGEKENVVQIEQVKTLIAKSKQELNLLQSQPKQFSNIYELLGIKFANSEQEKQFMEATSLILDSVKQATDAIIAESDRRLQAIENEISAKQKQVDDEKARAEEGAANNLAIRQRELDDLKAKKAEEEQVKRRALRVQQVIDTAMLVSTNAVTAANLIAAAAASFRSAAQSSFNPILGVIQAIAAIATIFATVASVRARAKAITQFRSGGKLRGPKHEQGGIPGTGYFDDIEVEGGEHVTNAKSSDRYDKTLTALNQNNPKKAFQALLLEGFGMPQIAIDRLNNQPVQVPNQSIDFSRLEQKIGSLQDELRAIRQNTGKNVVGVGDKLITVEGNKRTIEKLK